MILKGEQVNLEVPDIFTFHAEEVVPCSLRALFGDDSEAYFNAMCLCLAHLGSGSTIEEQTLEESESEAEEEEFDKTEDRATNWNTKLNFSTKKINFEV